MTCRSEETNWGLLFDIALSHGESLRRQRLTYVGFMTLLRSAGVVGPVTGIYQVLLGALWQHHGLQRSCNEGGKGGETKNALDLTMDIDGFITIMNVVCIRCYQAQRFSEMLEDDHPISEAVTLCAEEQGKIHSSVTYTMRRFFKPFISRSIVLKRMVVSLDSRKNSWTPYANRLITHILAASADSIVFPLFDRYAECGRIYRPSFEGMVDDIFPHFSPSQRNAALSVFTYDGFTGIHKLMEYVHPDVDKETRAALELHSFAEALLMLAIVAFSNESQHKHHRPFTAKVWAAFEDYYCKFLGVPMVSDPIKDNKFASITPSANLVFPAEVPLNKLSSFLISGWNLTVDDWPCDTPDPGKGYPPRILKFPEDGFDDIPLMDKQESAAKAPTSTTGMAAKLFEEELIRPTPAEYSLPIYGVQRCTVYVDEQRANAFQRAPNIVEVVIPKSMWNISIDGTKVEFVTYGDEGKLLLRPNKDVTISIRDVKGSTTFETKSVPLLECPFEQVILPPQMEVLRTAFSHHAANDLLPVERFDDACAELCIITSGTKDHCFLFAKSKLEGSEERIPLKGAETLESAQGISFSEFVSALATVLLRRHEARNTLPDIPYLLAVGSSRMKKSLPPLAEWKGENSGNPAQWLPLKLTQPHNARIDVPYDNALRKKSSFLRRYSGTEGLLKSLGKDHHMLRPLPAFPVEVKTVDVVSQYDDDEKGLFDKVAKTSSSLQESFLKEEMVVSRKGWTLE